MVMHRFTDQSRRGPPPYVFEVPGHRARYHLTSLVPHYGTAFCDRLARAWTLALAHENWQTSFNYFKAVRRLFEWVALRGAIEPASSEGKALLCFRDTSTGIPSDHDWQQVVANASGAILD